MGDVCKLMTKAMHRLIESRIGWDAQVVLDFDVLVELKFWHEQLHRLNARPIWREHALPSRVVYSDASAIGCAAFISINGKPVSHKNWDETKFNVERAYVLNTLCRVLQIYSREVS